MIVLVFQLLSLPLHLFACSIAHTRMAVRFTVGLYPLSPVQFMSLGTRSLKG